MSPTRELFAAFSRWRTLTQGEAAALATQDWGSISRSQSAKRHLQTLIDQAIQAAELEWQQSGADLAALQHQTRAELAELLALESANARLLSHQMAANKRRQAELRSANRTLGRVHHSYGSQARTAWQCYS
jgi:hypothetical protein